jgi:hypothetical protein
MFIGLAISATAPSAPAGDGLILPQPVSLPMVSGDAVEGETLSADTSDAWVHDGSPAGVTARAYQLLLDGGPAVAAQAAPDITLPPAVGGASYLMQLRVQVTEAPGLWSSWVTIASGTVGALPQLSAVSATVTGPDSCMAEVSTDTASGVLYWEVSQDITPSPAVKTGPSQPVTATGPQIITAAGLASATTYYVHFVQSDGAGHDSDPVSSQAFTTALSAQVPAAFDAADWAIADTGTGGDAILTITALPFAGAAALSGIEWRIGAGVWRSLGAVTPGNYPLNDSFIDGVAADITLRAINIIGPATSSDIKTVTVSGLPGAFDVSDWSVADDGTGADATVSLTALPATGGLPLSRVELRIDGGAWQTLTATPAPGTYALSGVFVDGMPSGLTLRVVNANGAGPESDIKSVTTTDMSNAVLSIGAASYAPGAGGTGPTLDITGVDLSGGTGPYTVFLATHAAGTTLAKAQIETGGGASADAISFTDDDGAVTGQTLTLSNSLVDGRLSLFIRDGLGAESAVTTISGVDVDAIAPVLSQVGVTNVTPTAADWEVVTDKAGGTIHVRARPAGDPQWTAEAITAAPGGSTPGIAAPALYGGASEPGLIALWDARDIPDGPVTTLPDLAGPFDLTAVAAPVASGGVITFDGVDDVLIGAQVADTGAAVPGARHVRDYSLPDASGGDAGQGFSIAGFAYDDADGTWWAVNGGLNYDGSSADRQQSLVHLSADFGTNLGEIDLDAVLPDLDMNDESPQAVAVDNAGGYLWVASPTARVIHCFDKGTGARVPANDITRGYDIGSLSIAEDGAALWVMSRPPGDATIQKISTDGNATVSVDFTIDLDVRHDHLTEKDGLLYVSCGTNGAQAFVVAIDPVQETVLARTMLPYPGSAEGLVGLEGIQFGQSGSVFIAHNGYFHYGDPGNPEAPLQWPRTNIVTEYRLPDLGGADFDLFALADVTPSGADCLVQFGSALDAVKRHPAAGLFPNGSHPSWQLRVNNAGAGDEARVKPHPFRPGPDLRGTAGTKRHLLHQRDRGRHRHAERNRRRRMGADPRPRAGRLQRERQPAHGDGFLRRRCRSGRGGRPTGDRGRHRPSPRPAEPAARRPSLHIHRALGRHSRGNLRCPTPAHSLA